MADLSVPYVTDQATKGMEEGKPEMLKTLHDPGREGTEEARKAHAHASTAAEDPPVSLGMGDHHHHHRKE
jgi:hypothetical protein